MGAQGYDIKHNNLFQDDQSAVKVEKNGKKSGTGNSRQLEQKYINNELRIETIYIYI